MNLKPPATFGWRRQWQPTPVRLPGKSHGWRSLVGCSPRGCEESDTTSLSLSLFTFIHWRRKWQPTPVFLPGESQGRGSLAGSIGLHRVRHDWSYLAAAASTFGTSISLSYTPQENELLEVGILFAYRMSAFSPPVLGALLGDSKCQEEVIWDIARQLAQIAQGICPGLMDDLAAQFRNESLSEEDRSIYLFNRYKDLVMQAE